MVMLGSCPDDLPPSQLGCHSYFAYLVVDDVDTLHQELAERGLQTKAPDAKPRGMRELVVRTPNGHGITFGQGVPAESS